MNGCVKKFSLPAAALAALTLGACGANTHGTVQPTVPKQAASVARMTFAHGAEVEQAPIFMVSEGNGHLAFPPGATLARTPNGIEVTYHGIKRTFSSAARVDVGTYRRYAKAQ